MKILRITLSNIASIAGTHTIDFTQEPLRSAGLYAISGQTGAGKSTLLDALCLALYDQTPRLNKLGRVKDIGSESQTASESLLRRGTARGFVEVVFMGIDSSPYTARWEVRRARESVDGALQDANIVLYKGHLPPDTKGETEAGGRKTAVLEAIRNKVGLSFEQFTRAVMLAQNDFAAFLKAKDTDRAEILQKLTGTQEYEEISKRVYQRCNEFQASIKAKNDLLQANPPFTDDERSAAEERYNTAKSFVATLEKTVGELKKHREWYDNLAELERKKNEAEDEWKRRLQQRDQSLQRRKEMELTEIVKHEATRLREDQKAAEKERNDACKKLASSSAEVDRINKEVSKASEKYDDANAALDNWQQQEPGIRAEINKAREVDKQIAVWEQKRRSVDDAFRNAKNAHNSKLGELGGKTEERKNLKTELDKIEAELGNLQSYESIAKDASLWINRIEDLVSLEVKISETKDVLSQQQGQVQEAQEKFEKQRQRFEEADKRHKAAQKAYEDADFELKQIDIDRLEKDWSAVEKSAAILRVLKGQLQTRNEKTNQCTDLQKDFEQLQSNRTTEELRLQELAEKDIPQAEVALKIAQELYDDIARQLEDRTIELRLALVEGKACPVCGSLHHPYSSNAPTEDSLALQAAADKVRQCKERRDFFQGEENSLKIKRAGNDQVVEKTQEDLKKLKDELSAFVFENTDNDIVALILAMPTNEQISETELRCCALEDTGKTLDLSRTAYRTKSKAIGELRNAEIQRKTEVANEKRALDTLESDFRKSDQECQQTGRDLAKNNVKKAEVIEALSPVWAALPEAQHDALVSGALFLEKFKMEIESFSTLLNRKNELAVSIAQLDPLIRSLSDDLVRVLGEKKEREKEFADTVNELEDRKAERNGLLGNRDIDEVEEELDQQRGLFKDRLNAVKNTLEQARNNQRAAEDNLSDTAEKAELANDKFTAANNDFHVWLRQLNESHLINWDVEQIDERIKRDLTWLISERKALGELDSSEGAAKTEHERCKQNLEMHREKPPTDQPYEVVREEFERQEEQLTKAMEEAGEALKPITLDDDRRARNDSTVKEIQELEIQAKPWQELNVIIGSADGSKFRTIAQQVSLDVLLQYTNQQLQQLAPRYRLKRLPSSLNLVVNDCDMGDETRSIYSLSGGETFLVSLALALGLASLTSNRVRIESLFIDEGFGSLDPETLNVAMGALMQLESQGRKVGVISHVPEMADAIPVQIKVKKGRNGSSRIDIPGVKPV